MTTTNPALVANRSDRRALIWELVIILAVTFGTSGVRAVLRLVEALVQPEPLNDQQVTLNQQQSHLAWLAPAFEMISSGMLFAWGGLAVFLLLRHLPPQASPRIVFQPRLGVRAKDWLHGVGLAVLIGVPGLLLYVIALQFGLSAEVVPSGLTESWWRLPALVLNSWANGVAEEFIVVAWLVSRLRQLGFSWGPVFAASALLRGSYHLYQGVSAGFGNVVMGLVFVYYFKRTGRVWPLVIAHGLIDSVAFVRFAVAGNTLGL